MRADKHRGQRRHALERTIGVPELVRLVAQGKAMIRRHDFAVRADGGQGDEMGAGAERADLGHLGRTEAAREGELALVGHLLAAKHQDRMLLEGRARRRVGGIVSGNIGERHAAQFGGKTWTQRDHVHRQVLPDFIIFFYFPPKRTGRQGSEIMPILSRACASSTQPRKTKLAGGNDERDDG